MALVLTVPNGQPNQYVDLITESQTPVRSVVTETNLSTCTAVAGFTTAAISAALASGAAEVCFPPGVYEMTGTVTQSQAGQVLNFAPGAVLRFAASGLGLLLINGDRASIIGKPTGRFDTTSAVAYAAVTLNGIGASCAEWLWEVNANVANCVLMRLAGDYSRVGAVTYTGVASFKIGTEHGLADNSKAEFTESGPHFWQMTDDGVTTRNYSSLCRLRATKSGCNGLYIEHGGRQLINAIIDDDGQANWIRNPQIVSAAGANFGILQRDDAEFLLVYGGQLTGNYLAGSVGIACGDGSKVVGPPAVGHLKLFDTKILNWDFGVRITGTCDTPEFFGATIANCKTAQIQIDSKRGADVWPVSGFGMFGCYSEANAFPAAPFLHCKSGDLLGATISGGEIGYTGTAVLVDVTMSINTLEVLGARLPAAAPTDAFTTPNTSSQFFFGRNQASGSNLISKGAFAARAFSIDDMVCTTLQTASLVVGSTGTATTLRKSTLITANFSGGVPALDFVELPFAVPGLLATDFLSWILSGGTAPGNTSLTFDCYIAGGGGSITLRARNNTAVAVPAVSTTLLAQYWRGF